MKKYHTIIVIFIFSINLNAQNWTFYSGDNDFDGKFKTSSIIGSASSYPYNKPRLVINIFDKDNSINFYISNSGYYSDSSDVEVLWVFNNEKEVIYETPEIILSSDGKSIFFENFKSSNSGEYLSVYEFIDKLKKATKVSVRVKSQFDTNDIKFSLRGSTKAINYVISEKVKKIFVDNLKREKKQKKQNSKIVKLLENSGVEDEIELKAVLNKIQCEFVLDDLEMKDIDSLNIKVLEYWADLKLYNQSGNLIKNISPINNDLIKKYIAKYRATQYWLKYNSAKSDR